MNGGANRSADPGSDGIRPLIWRRAARLGAATILLILIGGSIGALPGERDGERTRTKLDETSGLHGVQMIRPRLHHHDPIRNASGLVVDGADAILDVVVHLELHQIILPTDFAKVRGGQRPEAVGTLFVLRIAETTEEGPERGVSCLLYTSPSPRDS